MNSMASSRHFLAKHIYPCDVDGHLIVLDLGHDKYSRIGDTEADTLRYLLDSDKSPDTPVPSDINLAIDVLVEQGILTTHVNEGQNAASFPPKQATLDMKGYPFDGNPKIRTSHVINCFRAFLKAKFMRRFYSMERIVNRVSTRREKHLATAWKKPDISLRRVRKLVEIFRILKVLFYTSNDQCLFDSLTLVEFLSFYGVYPLWVFGVQMGPFQAHCWVQDSGYIYNDSVTHTDFFKPIMTA